MRRFFAILIETCDLWDLLFRECSEKFLNSFCSLEEVDFEVKRYKLIEQVAPDGTVVYKILDSNANIVRDFTA